MPSASGEQARGFLVVKRTNWFSSLPTGQPVPDRFPAIASSHDDILKSYRGIEGEVWSDGEDLKELYLRRGLAMSDHFDIVSAYYTRVCSKYQSDFIHCCEMHLDDELPTHLPPSFLFRGFDYGYYDSEDNHYSSLFNEIIYGKYPELRAYAKTLNSSLLFPTMEIVRRVDLTRKDLITKNADLETAEAEEAFAPIAIHAP